MKSGDLLPESQDRQCQDHTVMESKLSKDSKQIQATNARKYMSQALELKASMDSQHGVIFLFILHHLRILFQVLDTRSPGDQRPRSSRNSPPPPPLRGGERRPIVYLVIIPPPDLYKAAVGPGLDISLPPPLDLVRCAATPQPQ